MNIIADIIVILILAICIFFGVKRGLTGVIVKLLSIVISLVLSLILFKPVSAIIINHTDIYNNLTTTIEEALNSKDENNEEEKSTEPNIILRSINKQVDTVKENANNVIAKSIAEVIINLIVIVVLFIIINIIMFFLKFIFGAIASLPIIKQLDKLGGLVYGVIEGLLIIYIILAILSFVNVQEVQLALKTSYITSILYNNNLLLMLLF